MSLGHRFSRSAVTRIAEAFEGRSFRERTIISVTIVTVILVSFAQAVWHPQLQSMDGLRAQAATLESTIPGRRVALAELERRAALDPDDELRAQLASLERALVLQQKAYFDQLNHLVSPSEMISVLYDVLGNARGVELVSLENLPPQPLLIDQSDDASSEASPESSLYRHAVRVEFEANYFDTVSYLKSLEQVGERLALRSLHYEVTGYPIARVTIIVETLGMDTEWIGV